MIGREVLEIGPNNFVQGMSSGQNVSDGGFSNQTDAVNLTANLGVLNAPASVTDKTGSLAGNIIASAGDANSLGNDRYFLTDTGKYFTWDGSSLSLKQTDGSGSYVSGTSDFVQFQLQAFATTSNDVTLLTGSNLATIDATWWSVTKGKGTMNTSQRHPMIVFENKLWIGDKNNLHNWDGTTASTNVLALSSEQSIVSLGIEPGTGLMLIGITEGTNYSNSKAQIAKVLVFDGYSTKPRRSVIVADAINAFYPVSGTVFVTYGQNLGYWNGSGITFLRTLKNVTLNGGSLAYKHHITNIGSTLYVIDGKQVLAYGEVLTGKKVFYYALSNNISAASYDMITNIGNNKLGVAFASAKFYTLDVTSVASSGTTTFYSNEYNFPRPVWIRQAIVEFSDSLAASANPGTLSIIDQTQTTTAFSSLANSGSSAVYEITTTHEGGKVRAAQFKYASTSTVAGVRRVLVYYDVAE